MPKRWCSDCKRLYDLDSAPGLRCPTCQGIATARRNARPSSSARGYDGEYQRNKPVVIQQARQGVPCWICKKPIAANQKVTVEHKTPLRLGGTSELSNLAPAHSGCNTGWNRR